MVKKADIIAHVKVKRLEEVIPVDSMEGTKFHLKVNRYYKNRTVNSGEIFVYQAGSPKSQFKQNPLLKEGKEYILFLQEVDSPFGKALIMIQEGYGRYNFIDGDKVQRQLPLQIKNEPISYGEFVERLKMELLRYRESLVQ